MEGGGGGGRAECTVAMCTYTNKSVYTLKPVFAGPCTKQNPVLTRQIFMHQSAVDRTCTPPGSSGILSYQDSFRCTKGVRLGPVLLCTVCGLVINSGASALANVQVLFLRTEQSLPVRRSCHQTAPIYCKSINIQRIFIFGYFSARSCLAENLFARFSVTVYTGDSSTGRNLMRPKWVLALGLGGRYLNGPTFRRLTVIENH